MSAQLSFNRQSQNKVILDALLAGERLTPLKILSLCGSLRASGRIFDIRKMGYEVKTTMVKVGEKRVAEYRLEAQ